MTMLFENAHQALVFAFNRSSRSAARPLVDRIGAGENAAGMGLPGEDGAGQAGMILSRLSHLQVLHRALLRARYGPRSRDCLCCGQATPHHEWVSATRVIAAHARERFTAMPSVNEALILALVVRYFGGEKAPLEDIGSRHGVSQPTASRANRELSVWLRGPKSKAAERVIGAEAQAFGMAERVLLEAGMLGQPDDVLEGAT
ncbi:hypothetical protein ACSBPU_05650 [Parapusillimonas sp. JC17]|uniref:hypothetical protein n=1 Tax=Parapusillimonas sp. JC17 TaxID=3445768 RepID=UPI003F9F0D50